MIVRVKWVAGSRYKEFLNSTDNLKILYILFQNGLKIILHYLKEVFVQET